MKILIGFVLGFVGYLPLGNINLTVVQLALDESARKVWMFILFAALMEFVYCVGCLEGMNALLQNPHWVNILQWSSVSLFVFLGVLSFLQSGGEGKRGFTGVKRGIFIAIFNPLQIPFWIVWGVYVMENKWLERDLLSISFFGLVTAIGTIAVLWLYAIGGKKLVERLNVKRTFLNQFIGAVFIFLAIWQLYKILHPAA